MTQLGKLYQLMNEAGIPEEDHYELVQFIFGYGFLLEVFDVETLQRLHRRFLNMDRSTSPALGALNYNWPGRNHESLDCSQKPQTNCPETGT